MSEAYTTPEELFAEQEAILARIARCQDLLGSAIFRARVALGIEPTTQAFFQDQVSWAKRGAAPAPVRAPKPAPVELAPPVATPPVVIPVPVAVAPPPALVVPPQVGDSPEVLAGFTAGAFFRQQVAWVGSTSPTPRTMLLDQLVIGQETPALPTTPPSMSAARPAQPPIDDTMAAGAFFKTVPWQAGQSAAFGTRSNGGNFLAAATESALRAAQRLSTKPAP